MGSTATEERDNPMTTKTKTRKPKTAPAKTVAKRKAPAAKTAEILPPSLLTHEKQTVRVADLKLSPLNPRQHVSEDEIAVLAASIKAIGLLQDMAGLETKSGVEIVFGGRRMRALQKIVAEDNDSNMAVDVIMAKDEREAIQWAGAENTARTQPHPADEIIAYKKSIDLGAMEDQIAKAFGVTVRHVKGRLKLAGLAPVILDALRADEITLDIAAAYTMSDDQDKQAELYDEFKDHWIGREAGEIKARLNTDAVDCDDNVARFVTRETYEAAGGRVNEDLFGDDTYFLDRDLLYQLADDKCETIKAEFEQQGWNWVECVSGHPSWEAMRPYAQVYPQQVPFTEEDEENYNELAALIESGNAQEADVEAFNQMEERLNKKVYSDDQKAHAGVMFWIGYNGKVDTNMGYVAPDDIKAAVEAGVLEKVKPVSTPAKKKGPYPEALMRDMSVIRTCSLQKALLDKPDFALDLLFFALTSSIYSDQNPIGLSTTNKRIEVKEDDGQSVPETLEQADFVPPINAETAAKALAKFRKLPKKAKQTMMVEQLARTLSAGLSLPDTINPLVELLATETNACPRDVWTPTTSFLKRLTSAQLDQIMAFINDGEVGRNFLGMKKMDKVARLHALFNNEVDQKGLSDHARNRLAIWMPQGFENIDMAVGELPQDALDAQDGDKPDIVSKAA